jgi:hypothetical protein
MGVWLQYSDFRYESGLFHPNVQNLRKFLVKPTQVGANGHEAVGELAEG